MSIISESENLLSIMKDFYNKQNGALEKIIAQKKEKQNKVESLKKEKESIEIKKTLLKESAIEARRNASVLLEGMATSAIKFIMEDDKRVEIVSDDKGADILVFEKQEDGSEVDTDPTEEDGGGVADIVSLASFMALNQSMGVSNVAPLFLDEPSKYVSKGYSQNVAKFLYDVSSYYKKQVFMVTHDEGLASSADIAYHLNKIKGKSIVTRLK